MLLLLREATEVRFCDKYSDRPTKAATQPVTMLGGRTTYQQLWECNLRTSLACKKGRTTGIWHTEKSYQLS